MDKSRKCSPKAAEEDIRKRFTGYTPVGEHGYRHFAVLLPLVEKGGSIEVLYEIRAGHLDRQPGEICFPGGMIERGETPMVCALRETEEEIGIDGANVEIIAELCSIFSTGGSQIYCFIGIIGEEALADMALNRAEVDEVFTVPLEKLMETEPEVYMSRLYQEPDPDFPYDRVTGGKMYPWRSGTSPVPVFEVDGHVIWGLTGRLTKQFLEVLRCSD